MSALTRAGRSLLGGVTRFRAIGGGDQSGINRMRLSDFRDGADVKDGVRWNWWRQGMIGSVLAHTLGIKAFSETDFTADLKAINVPTLVMHGEDDQVVPFPTTSKLSAGIVKGAQLKSYPGFPHGMPTTHAAQINDDLLAFVES